MGTAEDNHHIDPESGYCLATGIYHSKRKPIPLPDDPFLTLPEFILHRRAHDHSTAYVDAKTWHTLTYVELRLQVRAAAAGLAGFGVRQGDVVLILSPNSIHFTVIMLGVMLIGAVITTTNPLNTPAEIAKQTSDSGAKFVATIPTLLGKVAQLKLPLILIGDEQDETKAMIERTSPFIPLTKLLSADPEKLPVVRARQQDAAALLYSSGTTGASKGVIITHRNLIAQASLLQNREEGMPWAARVYLCLVPMFHIYGLTSFCTGYLSWGCTIVIMPKFDMVDMLAAIQKYRVTHMPVVPPILISLAKLSIVDKYDLSSLCQVACGAAPLSKEVIGAFGARFPNVRIVQGYGLTESTSVGVNSITAEECEHYGSTGLVAANTEAKIVDVHSGKSLPPNQPGELWLRGPSIMKGYFGRPGETAATIDKEGWLHTGDLCYVDMEGYLFVVDRLKELIKYKGLQVAPAELEAVLLSHAEIVDAAVVPFPDEEAGQIPMAYIVRAPGSALTEVEAMNFVAEQVAPYKKIRRVAVVNNIPKSPSGKILRRELVIQATSKL